MATSPSTAPAEAAARPRRKLPLVLGVVALVVLAAGAGWFFLLREPAGEPEAEPAPVPGEVLTVDPVSINLANGSYLRLALGLQLTEEATAEEPDPSAALDLAVATFSGRSVAELSDAATREAVQDDFTNQVKDAYEEGVIDVYFTEFVTQ